jgi:sulfatase maturation enzyme AslB (radical SAM superfamily)
MAWPVLRRAVELAATSRHARTKLVFSGGEPLLARDLFVRALTLVRRLEQPDRRVEVRLMTNGMLLDDDLVDLLDDHRVRVQLSVDGVAEAQSLRSPDSVATLDRLLRRIRRRRPRFLRERVRIAATVSSATVGHLERGVRDLVGSGAAEVSVGPVFNWDPGWTAECTATLDHELGKIRRWCAWTLGETGRLTFTPLRRHGDGEWLRESPDGAICTVPSCQHLTVDVDGRLAPCLLAARSYMPEPGGPLATSLAELDRGTVDDPWNSQVVEHFVTAVRRTGLFHHGERQGEGGRPCSECDFVDECHVCPVAIAWIPGSADPHRAPDHICAFNRTLAAHRRLMPKAPTPLDLLHGTAPLPRAVARILGRTTEH